MPEGERIVDAVPLGLPVAGEVGAELPLVQDRRDGTDGPGATRDLDVFAHLVRPLLAELSGRDDLVFSTQFIAVFHHCTRLFPVCEPWRRGIVRLTEVTGGRPVPILDKPGTASCWLQS